MQNGHYHTIEKAITYIRDHFQHQPSLDEIAAHVHMSPYHFQRTFHEWAGVTPKKFLQHVSLNYAKYLLREKQLSLFDTTMETGLSGTSRLHDLFIQIEGMTPAEYKNGGKGLVIRYAFYDTRFGKVVMASTPAGICFLHFIHDENEGLQRLHKLFPNAAPLEETCQLHEDALNFLHGKSTSSIIRLHVKGSPFQLKVWEALLQITEGRLTTYGHIGEKISTKTASRAIGTAIGQNPVAVLIPCHRVIRGDGGLGGYMWGLPKKAAIIGWEQTKR